MAYRVVTVLTESLPRCTSVDVVHLLRRVQHDFLKQSPLMLRGGH